MVSNKDAATRAMVIAERKLMEKDICEAKIQASMALNFCPELDGLPQLIKVIDIHISYAKTVCGEVDWYGVLGVDPCFDDEIIRKQFLKLARMLHPDKNKTSYAEGAFKILSQAWSVLSDKARRETYDLRLGQLKEVMRVPPPMQTRMNDVHANSSSHPSKSKSFWTTCRLCKSYFEYKISYFNQLLHCKKCREPFFAVLQPPPLEKGRKSLKSISFLQHPPAGAQTSSGPVVSSLQAPACAFKDHERIFSSVPVSGTTALSSTQSNDYEKIHASLFQSEYPLPQVLGNVDHDISKTENKVSCISRRELTKKRQADECFLLSKGRAEMANKKAAGRLKFRLGNQCTDMNNNLGANSILVHGSSKSNNTGNLSQSRLRSALVQKAKSDLHKKLNEWSIPSPSVPMPKIDMKKQDSTDTAEGSDATSAKNTKKVDAVIQNVQGSRLTEKSSVATDCKNIYPNTEDYVTMDVPDPDFHDFDQQRIEELFSEGQIWALYDDDDGMPRFYALITSIESVRPFKIQINRLNSKANTEIGPTKCITSGYTKTIGEFRIGKHVVSNALSAFSHVVKSKRFPRGIIQIYPGKGETWALYRNWSPSWNERTPEEEIHQYDIVLVLDDYSEQQGVFVSPLVKVAGFRSVFRQQDSVSIQTIQKGELFRFSHQVPSYTLTGEEARNAPKGCMELDPAAMPSELLKFIQVDVVQEDGNSDSTGKSEDEYNRNRLNRLVITYSRRKKSGHTLHSGN